MSDPLSVYVDVDDTLIRTTAHGRIAIPNVVEAVRRLSADGAHLYLWSAGGAEYAREVAAELGIAELFLAFLPKPEVMIDDRESPTWWMIELRPEQVGPQTSHQQLEGFLVRGKVEA